MMARNHAGREHARLPKGGPLNRFPMKGTCPRCCDQPRVACVPLQDGRQHEQPPDAEK